MSKTFRRFSIDAGYESPPLEEEFEDDTTIGDGERVLPSLSKKRFCTSRSMVVSIIVVVVALVSLLVGSSSRRGQEKKHPVYSGEPQVCDSHHQASALQDLKSFASLKDIEHGAVAADHPKCSEIGLSMLRDLDGNAVDAAVATALCLGVANPSSSGIGGGAFILIHASSSTQDENKLPKFHDARNQSNTVSVQGDDKITEVIDCRDVAGQAASTYMYETEGVPPDASLYGGLAVAVPGELRGLELAHARHGKLDWATVVQPAMELARDGIPVYNHLAQDIRTFQIKQKSHGGFPTLRKLLTHNDDWKHILKEGEILRNPELAKTLQAVMKEGADAVYTGQRAEQLAQEIQKEGGILTKEDFEKYYPTLRSPAMSDNVFGFRVVGVPPPSSGGAAIIGALRFLKGYAAPLASYADTLSVHRMVEALKHVFAIRMSLADPAYPIRNNDTNATTQDAVDALVQGPYMEELRRLTLDDDILNLSHYGGARFAQLHDTDGQKKATDAKEGDRRRYLKESQQPQQQQRRRLYDPFGYLEDHGTSHLSVVDKHGNAVAMTTSVNAQFGACVVSESTGIVLNNQMDDFGNPGRPNYFGLKPSEANFIQPGKKPLSSMSPTMVFQASPDSDRLGQLRLVLGGSGGPKIITAVLQVIINYLLLGKPLFDSVAKPRIHNQLIYHGAATTTLENSVVHPSEINLLVSNRTRTALAKRGHPLVDIDYAGTVQAVAVDTETGLMEAVCDIRKGGSPVGY
ncbi:Glutathione hydrolase 1 proenzyme [Seminavis robusta]|uniref:Glutathione hydrolase 1 proenzyme n=1 Tax=Seminavis robusta TaxID=568900 RepID=A0A9N8DYZ8_9STRA|nr:Glutathione hydrolase 1 proenzyme [Seminavis robusta]|eukprot:Sro485_g152450.1 Glutathione hydrolase 1 proenzyme (746) ;mRNA; r:40846-43159